MLRLSGFIAAFTAAADLMMQQYCQIKRATNLPRIMFSTQFTNQVLVGFV
jgi:hypothetical protein